jgi:hypothetical protein
MPIVAMIVGMIPVSLLLHQSECRTPPWVCPVATGNVTLHGASGAQCSILLGVQHTLSVTAAADRQPVQADMSSMRNLGTIASLLNICHEYNARVCSTL